MARRATRPEHRRAWGRADQLGFVLRRQRLGARRGDRPVLPAPVLEEAARPQLGEPRGPAGGLLDDELVARPGRGRLPHGRHQPDLQGHRTPRRLGPRRRPARRRLAVLRVRPADPRVPPGDVPRGLRGPRAAPPDRRRDARRDHRRRRSSSPTQRGRSWTWCSSSSTWASTGGATPRPLSTCATSRPPSGVGRSASPSVGWNSLYWDNHDQPRAVSRFGDDSPEHRVASAQCLATAAPPAPRDAVRLPGRRARHDQRAIRGDRRLPRHRVPQPLRRDGRPQAPTQRRCWPPCA